MTDERTWPLNVSPLVSAGSIQWGDPYLLGQHVSALLESDDPTKMFAWARYLLAAFLLEQQGGPLTDNQCWNAYARALVARDGVLPTRAHAAAFVAAWNSLRFAIYWGHRLPEKPLSRKQINDSALSAFRREYSDASDPTIEGVIRAAVANIMLMLLDTGNKYAFIRPGQVYEATMEALRQTDNINGSAINAIVIRCVKEVWNELAPPELQMHTT